MYNVEEQENVPKISMIILVISVNAYGIYLDSIVTGKKEIFKICKM